MKNLLLAAAMILLCANFSNAQSQQKEDVLLSQSYSGHIFDGISGIMVYSLYQNNNYLMNLYTSRAISSDSALDMSVHQLRASEYVLELVNTKILEVNSSRNVKRADVKYLRELKSALIVISGQARSLKEYIEGGSVSALKKFDLNRASAQRMVNGILRKE